MFEDGNVRMSSELRGLLLRSKPDFPDREWCDEFSAYEQVLQKLVEGWHPVGFVAMNRDSRHHRHARMHPVPFAIDLKIPRPKLEECLHRCDKIRLAYEIEEQWRGWSLKTSPEYFNPRLDRNMIQAAADALRKRLGPPPYYEGQSPPLISFDKWDIRLIASRGILTFQTVRRVGRRW